MALIDMVIDANTNYVVFEANNAAEMQQKLRDWIADNGALFLWDAELVGGGGAPRFACALTVGGAEGGGGSINPQVNTIQAYAQGGMDPIPPTTLSASLVAAIQNDTILLKSLVATGGGGPHWMEVAITAP